jgi:hypothetical protein
LTSTGGAAKALVFLSHGFSEHLGLYMEIGTFLSKPLVNMPLLQLRYRFRF